MSLPAVLMVPQVINEIWFLLLKANEELGHSGAPSVQGESSARARQLILTQTSDLCYRGSCATGYVRACPRHVQGLLVGEFEQKPIALLVLMIRQTANYVKFGLLQDTITYHKELEVVDIRVSKRLRQASYERRFPQLDIQQQWAMKPALDSSAASAIVKESWSDWWHRVVQKRSV